MIKKLQQSACKQIRSEAKSKAKPIVFNLAKETVFSLSNEIVPDAAKETLNALQIQQTSFHDKLFLAVSGGSSDVVPLDCAKVFLWMWWMGSSSLHQKAQAKETQTTRSAEFQP